MTTGTRTSSRHNVIFTTGIQQGGVVIGGQFTQVGGDGYSAFYYNDGWTRDSKTPANNLARLLGGSHSPAPATSLWPPRFIPATRE